MRTSEILEILIWHHRCCMDVLQDASTTTCGWCMRAYVLSCFSCVPLLETVALQAPLSLGLFRQEYWSVLSCPPPGDLPHPGIKPTPLMSPALLYHKHHQEAPVSSTKPQMSRDKLSRKLVWHCQLDCRAGMLRIRSYAAACCWVIIGHVQASPTT